jgi:polysaccharide pyruvyl transferase WcaK-like protein
MDKINKMNIAILNAEAGGNKGAEAMLEVLIIKLLEEFPAAHLYLEIGTRAKYYNDVFLKRFNSGNIHLLYFNPKKVFAPYHSEGLDIKKIHCAIDIGGINFHDGSTRGPAKKRINKIIGKFILSKAAGIFTRSEKSLDQVLSNFKIDASNIFGPFPDTTLLYQPHDQYNSTLLKEKEYVVFTPSAIMYAKYGDEYIDLFSKLYEYLMPQYKIVILVHNFTMNMGSSDEIICKRLSELCPQALLINENIATGELKSILKNAKFSISSRYHVVVGSISQNVPSVAIGWNPKYESFLKLYGKQNWNIEFGNRAFVEITNLIDDKKFNASEEELKLRNIELKKDVSRSFSLLFSKMND